jgi:lipopolysaccharide biosynthesis glycosyltransferase
MKDITIYIGYDSANYGQQLAHDVCKKSIQKYNTDIKIKTLIKSELEKSGDFIREQSDGSTEFTYTRFLAPHLNNFEGYAIFCDSDFLWQCDPAETLQYLEEGQAAACVQHEYVDCHGKEKMDGQKQEWYPRKNWSSLIIFDCAHSSCKKLTKEAVATESPAWLHRLSWADDSEIGSIPLSYNYLVDYYNLPVKEIKAFHFTDGGPWHALYQDVQYGDLWAEYLTAVEYGKLHSYLKQDV